MRSEVLVYLEIYSVYLEIYEYGEVTELSRGSGFQVNLNTGSAGPARVREARAAGNWTEFKSSELPHPVQVFQSLETDLEFSRLGPA
jgi:hypothetical protein